MAPKLNQQKQDGMFTAYCEKPTVYYVAAKCKVSPTTARRYRDKENWVKRREKIKEEAQKKGDKTAAGRLAESLKIVDFGIARLVAKIRDGTAKSTSTYSELDKLMRLREFLYGAPDSRLAVSKYDGKSDEELLQLLKDLKKMS